MLCLDARDPEAGDIVFASTLCRPPFVVAVSTGGRAPAVARALARHLDQQMGPEWQIYAELMARARDEVKDKVPAPARGSILRTLADLPLLDVIRQRGESEARAEAAAVIRRAVDDR